MSKIKLPKRMGIKRIILLIIVCFYFGSCFQFNGEKIEINYRDKTIKVLSDDYIIESILMKNHQSKYYLLELKDTLKGSNTINLKDKSPGYNIVVDSLDYYCSIKPDIDSPGVWVTIIKKGFKNDGDHFKEMQYFNFNKLPCNSNIIDTIVASNPYK
ncbi:hypothetical protein ACQ9BO_18935 [Flavobacterium sp. P21]|uniref:hypothetical protein n=1 Tax=Flavobacterium sp. P21 TaxID=3423948 RepID=UPI003D6754FC